MLFSWTNVLVVLFLTYFAKIAPATAHSKEDQKSLKLALSSTISLKNSYSYDSYIPIDYIVLASGVDGDSFDSFFVHSAMIGDKDLNSTEDQCNCICLVSHKGTTRIYVLGVETPNSYKAVLVYIRLDSDSSTIYARSNSGETLLKSHHLTTCEDIADRIWPPREINHSISSSSDEGYGVFNLAYSFGGNAQSPPTSAPTSQNNVVSSKGSKGLELWLILCVIVWPLAVLIIVLRICYKTQRAPRAETEPCENGAMRATDIDGYEAYVDAVSDAEVVEVHWSKSLVVRQAQVVPMEGADSENITQVDCYLV